MSISYSACIVLGLPFKDLPKKFQDVDVIEDHGLVCHFPFFDCDVGDTIVGFCLHEAGTYKPYPLPQSSNIKDQVEKFQSLVGVTPGLYLTPHAI